VVAGPWATPTRTPGDAPEVLGRELLAQARVADEVREGDGDIARAGQAAGLARGLRHELAAHAVAQMGAELMVEQGRHERGQLVGRRGEAQADGVLAVARLHQRVAHEAPDRLGGVRHALAEHARDLEQLAPRQPGVHEAFDHARGLDVLVGEDALAAPRVGAPDGLHELTQEGRPVPPSASSTGQRRQPLLGVRALDLLVVGARAAQACEQQLAVAHRSIQAWIWS
jgi:hypothetical protein